MHDDPIAGFEAYPEAPRNLSVDASMEEPDTGLGPDGASCSWADMMECHRTGITPGALRRLREAQAAQDAADWRREVDCPGSGPAWLRPWKPEPEEALRDQSLCSVEDIGE